MEFNPAILEGLKFTLSGDNRRVVIRSSTPQDISMPDYSFGIEEEYFLADAATLEARHTTSDDFFEAVNWSTGGQAMREMLQAQLEVATNIHVDVRDACQELKFLRHEASKVATQFGLAIMAAGTHPTASWRDSKLSPKTRYQEMIEDLRVVGRRNMLCGMHVHVQLPDPAKRFPVMCAMIPYLPLFIALATSSPFWNGRATGLKGYRLAAYDELPRTGLPELFCSEDEYRSYVEGLTRSGVMPDESYIWWAMRPSMRHPTLELRAPDSCTKLEDAIAIASLYRALVRYLFRHLAEAEPVTVLDRAIAVENKWRAQRYGVDCSFVTRTGPIALADFLSEILARIADDADHLRCRREVDHCKRIVRSGSSADHQLRVAEFSAEPLSAAKTYIANTTIGLTPESQKKSVLFASPRLGTTQTRSGT
jgi:glutamate---cysteine ligase / carboxylate-amine ligase